MITKVTAFRSSDDKTFDTLQAVQQHEILILLAGEKEPTDIETGHAQSIVANAEKVIDILSTTPKSKPKARAINGGTKRRGRQATTAASANQPATTE